MDTSLTRSTLAFLALALAAPLADAQLPYPWGVAETDNFVQASTPVASDQFGLSVDLKGDVAVVSAQGDDDLGINSGAVYVLGRNVGGPGAWGETMKLTANDGAQLDYLGRQVAIGGNLIVANSQKVVTFPFGGAVYFFDATTGAQLNRVHDGSVEVSGFGKTVDTDGVNVVAGMQYNAPGPGMNQGRAAVYDAVGNFRFHLYGSDVDQDDWFGEAVTVEGPYVAVGAESKENGGAVYVYDSVTGLELFKLVGSGVTPGKNFGRELDIDGNRMAVAGGKEAWVFDLTTGAELWHFDGEGFPITSFAYTIAIANDWVYLGSSSTVFPGGYQGRVIQVCLSSGLTNVQFHNVTPTQGILSRDSLAADGDTILSGDGFSGNGSFNGEGMVNFMTRADLGLSISTTLIAAPDFVSLTMRGLAPGIPAALALTAVNGVPIPPAIFFVAAASAQGEPATPVLTAGPALSGLTLEITGGGLAKSGAIAFTNAVEIVIL